MTETPSNQFIRRFFYQQTLRTRVVLTQLPFVLTVALAAIMIVVLSPDLLSDERLIASLGLTAVLTISCFVLPWDRLPRGSFLVIPYADFIAVALFREGSQTLLLASGMLALFPIFWLCASGLAPKTAVASSTVASLLIIWNPVFQSGTVTARALFNPLLFPFMMFAFAVTVVVMTTSMDSQRKSLLAKDVQLRAALEDSQLRERLLGAVVDTVGVGVVVVDEDGNDRLMNSAQVAIHALGRPPQIADPEEKELLVFSPDRVPLAAEARPVRRAVNGESFTNYQVWIGSGEDARAFTTTARTIRHADGRADGAVIAFHDVTDMVKALAAKDDFVANVSHEFRTPLTAIQAYISMALEAPDLAPQEVTQYLTIADRNAQRLEGLVSDLLTTSAITVERAPSDVARLLAETLVSVAPAAAANSVVVDWHYQQPLMAMVDPVRIGQVLDNLVSNAVKYSPDGGTLTVRAWAEGTELRCTVTDTGMGMTAAEKAGVFQKFFRAGTAVERGIPGIGLGLMISKTIIETHGGTLSIDSELGTGTTMSFAIPGCVLGSHLAMH